MSAGPSVPSRRQGPGLASAPPLARSAVRVPPNVHVEGTDQPSAGAANLFVHEGARQQLERNLRRVLGKRIILAITDNRRAMVSAVPSASAIEVRVHHMFLDADPFTQSAVGRYLRYGDRAASLAVGAYIEANQQRIKPAKARQNLPTRGRKHDLQAMYNRLNDTYFQGMVDASVTWARRSKPANGQRASIKLGTYCADRKLIRIHPALDRSWVPGYFVEYVVFHEMLHHMMPMPVRDGRRELHTPEFRAGEQRYRNYARAIEWEQRHIGRLLRA